MMRVAFLVDALLPLALIRRDIGVLASIVAHI